MEVENQQTPENRQSPSGSHRLAAAPLTLGVKYAPLKRAVLAPDRYRVRLLWHISRWTGRDYFSDSSLTFYEMSNTWRWCPLHPNLATAPGKICHNGQIWDTDNASKSSFNLEGSFRYHHLLFKHWSWALVLLLYCYNVSCLETDNSKNRTSSVIPKDTHFGGHTWAPVALNASFVSLCKETSYCNVLTEL